MVIDLWENTNLPAPEIGRRLGGFTKGQVIGKVHSLKLRLRGKPTGKGRKLKRRTREAVIIEFEFLQPSGYDAEDFFVVEVPQPNLRVVHEREEHIAPTSPPPVVTHECRWPKGSLLSMSICGRPTLLGSIYCEEHDRLAKRR